MKHPKTFSLSGRILLILSGVAALSTLLALVIQDRTLSLDLREAALARLERAEHAAELLVENHFGALEERYRAISGTPQFRATLEVGDQATLEYYAEQLREREGAAGVAFVAARAQTTAVAGDPGLMEIALQARHSDMIAYTGNGHAVIRVPLLTNDEEVGQLVAVEPLDGEIVGEWSALCGADVYFATPRSDDGASLERVVRSLADLELRVAVATEAEEAALRHSRESLIRAGGVALALAFVLSVLMARNLVRPILAIKEATIRIGRGDFGAHLGSRRTDEIGDMARAVDGMRDRLISYREKVAEQHGELEEHVEHLSKSQEQLARAQRLAHVGSWSVDLQSGELTGSEEFKVIFGLEEDAKIASAMQFVELVHSDDRTALRDAFTQCVAEGGRIRLDCRINVPNRPGRVVHVEAAVQHDADRAVRALEGWVQDITERKRSEEQIRYLAYHDNLTGLGNRLYCREHLDLEIAKARRSGAMLGVLELGLDRFKRINDTFGHAVGDELLKGVADRLAASMREADAPGPAQADASIARLTGDEFTIIVPKPHDAQDLAKAARRILEALSAPFVLEGHEVVVSGSIGISAFPHDGTDAEALLHSADVAMNHAKEQGGGDYQFYAESMNQVALMRLIMENKMRQGLERGEFELHYQPKLCLATGRMVAAEALMRWRDPEAGLISPGVFIPVAEESGLIGALGDWALDEACRQIAAWQHAGHALPISVNLSPHQFRSGDLAKNVLATVERHGIAPSLLELEITESTLMHDKYAVIDELQTLRRKGIRTSVDDFGTGYSSFAYLKNLPVDAIKIDRSFIIDVETSQVDAELAASIVSMGHALRLTVIAEGVETEAQRKLLASWQCDEMQGFLFSPALPPEEFEALVTMNAGLTPDGTPKG